jgi:hypothetical protein
VRRIRPDGNSDDPMPPMELYKLAVEEYRFQAQFNWTRTQSLLVFNTAVLAAGTAVSARFGAFAVPVFALGIVACIVGVLVMRQQHDYYRAARDRMRRIEDREGLTADLRVDTTSTLGRRHRSISVTQLIYLLTAAIGVADAVAIGYVLTR